MAMCRIANCILVVLFVASCARVDTPGEVLDHMVEAYGGERALVKASRMVQEWEFVALTGDGHGLDRRSLELPGRLKVELTYADKAETRLLNGDVGFVAFSGSGVRVATGPQRDAMQLQLMRLYSPLALRDRLGLIDMVRTECCWLLTLSESGLRTDYVVDAESFHINKVVGFLSIGGAEMSFTTLYSDFGVIDGVLVHRREEKFAGSTGTAVLHLRDIAFGVEFDKYEFDVPGHWRGEDVEIARN